ncbi:AAA family ATPase [Scytonema sp. NUACC26]|uniref:AAA family ATPase n=1 Tax=Scytonema sp. NUACC26 TaxID=3140176 RepID=UPI0034DC1508
MEDCNFVQILQSIPDNAQESIISNVIPEFLKNLGYSITETVPHFATGSGNSNVDYAIRKNTSHDVFIRTKSNPNLLLEIKGRDINLSENSTHYNSAVHQLKRYLLAPNCQSAQWGIITNLKHIQLFRKHGKAIHPALPCMEMRLDNAMEVIEAIKSKIANPQKALTVAIYNNKGGVGKTTTTVNLAATLSLFGKRSLIVDFDPNQQDLTNSLGLKPSQDALYSWLENKSNQIPQGLRTTRKFTTKSNKVFQFDVITSDEKLTELGEDKLRQVLKFSRLRQALEPLKLDYDYILIDSPPNWRFFSQSAVYAADVVLIPTKHNNIFSLENAAIFINRFLPEVKQLRNDGGPMALPIFFNGEQITDAQKLTAEKAIDDILNQAKKDKNSSCDLTPYFYPRFTPATKNFHIFNVPSFAHIANAAFARVPAVYKNRTAYEYYVALAKEYFLQ